MRWRIWQRHYRTQTGIEVKASATVDGKDFKGLRHFQATEGPCFQRGLALYAGLELLPFGDNLWAAPLSLWWAEPSAAQPSGVCSPIR